MLSRNNRDEQFKKYEPKKQRFTIKKLSIGVASVLLGLSFANGVSADTTDNASVNDGKVNGSSEETDHNLVLNSASASTLKEATAANSASAAIQNPVGDVRTPTANEFEAAVSAAVENTTKTATSDNVASQDTAEPVQIGSSVSANHNSHSVVETQPFNIAAATNMNNDFSYSNLLTNFAAVPANFNNTVDLDTYNPDFNITDSKDYSRYFNVIPNTQIGFIQWRDKRNNNILTGATDRDNPGDNLYFYVNGKMVTKISKDDYTKPWSGPMVINQTVGEYKGGSYNYSRAVNTQVAGTDYRYTRVNVYNRPGTEPISIPSTGAFTSGGSNLKIIYGYGDPIEDSSIAQQNWNSAGGSIPGKIQQTIWYVDADTGEVMAQKVSNKLVAGQQYDLTNAGPQRVSYNGKTYELVARNSEGIYDANSFKSSVLNSVLTNNAGINITVADVLSAKLHGMIGNGRKGNINVGVTDYGPARIYISQQIDSAGTVALNTYDTEPSDTTRGAIKATLVQAGNISTPKLPSVYSANTGDPKLDAEAATAQGDRSAFFNDRRPGNQDVIFLYRKATPIINKQNATITFVDDDNGSSLSPAQNATGDADTQITFDNAASTVSNILGQGYTYVQTTGNGVTGGNTGSFSGVTFPAYDSDDNTTQSFVVHFKKAAPTVSYTYGEPESVTIHRTINYYDKVTGAKIPSNLIAQNPVTDEVTFTRTPVLENGVKVGYGTINAEGTGYTKQDWHTADGEVGSTQFAAKRSNDLSAYNYTAPEFRDGESASVVPADTVTPTTKDIVYDVYYGHQTQPVNNTKTVTRHFHYVFTDGSDPASKLTPQTDQTVTFNGTATKDLVTGKTSDTVYTPATGTLAQVNGQAVDGYKIVGYTNGTPDGGAVALNVTPTSGDTDVTIVYTPIEKPKPQADEKASVKIVDQDTNKILGTFNNQGVAGDSITFVGEPETLTSLLNGGYTFVSAVNDKNGSSIGDQNSINFGNFDNDTTTDQAFTITLKHGQKVTNEQGTSIATVHYVIAGNDANKPAAPADNGPQTINWTRTVTTDQVTGDITYGNWTPDKQTFNDVNSPAVTGYTPDKATATFTTPVVNKDQVVTVVYSKAPEQDQKADLIVYDKTDNNKQLNNFDNSGKAGTQITFSGAANYVADLIAKGYQIDSFVNDQNVTSNPSSYSQIAYDTFDSNANSDQHFKLYLVHGTENANQTKNTTSTVHYVVSDGKATPPADHTETITWTQPGTKDKVTGAFTPTGNWTTPDHYTDVPSPSLEGYTVDKTNVPAPTPNPDQNPTTTVTYSPKTPEAPTYTGTDEVREVTRTINYYDKVTGQKIPADLIHDNPTTQTVQLKRTHVVSSTGQDMGYGTISNDGKTFTKATTADGWNTGSWNQVVSPILTNAGYTAPDLAQADQVTVDSATKDAVVNVYYGHETVLVTPDKPQNPGDKINPNDPRNNPPAYPDGLTKTDLQQSVTRTINYKGINENGQTVDVNGAPDGKNTYTQTVNFERHVVVDKVTGEVLGYDTNADTVTPVVTTTDANRAWMPASQNMASVASKAPSEVGYDNVDLSSVGGMTVYPGQQISDVTVTYTKNKTPEVTQKATLEIIDNNDANAPKQLASFGNEGKSTDQITFANSDQILQGYLNQGYTVQKTDGNLSGSAQTGYTYPTYGSTAQDFKIYLVHGTKDVTENATATAQVHYVVADNGVQAPADSTLQTINYSRTNTVDKVTGATVNEGTWKADKNAFTDVKSPDLSNDGYTASVDNVQFNAPERGVNQRVTVVYNRSAQAADLQIIDDNDPANQSVLAVYSDNGESGKAISFNGSNDQLKKYLAAGYTFEKADGQGMKGDATNGFTYPSFDNDAKSNQSFKIYLKHGTKDQTTTAQATAHVHYIMADGTKAPDDSATQTVTWTRTDTVDAVTGAVKTTGEWGTPSGNFESVKSPEVTGYTPGTETVNFATPEPNKNQVVNVVYTKNPETPATQKAVVVYQDVNDPANVVELTRSSELTGNAGDAVNYSTADEIAKLENEGYVLVSNGFDPNGAKPSFDNINDNTQTFYVTLKHGIQPVNPTTPGTPSEPINPNDPNPAGPKYPAGTDKTSLTHDVTRTVTYEGAGEQTPSPVTDTLHFQGAGYLDKVTGKWTDANGKELADQTKGITWTIIDGTKDNGSFDLVPTKHINGYTSQVETAGADDGNGNVKSYTGINHSTADINVVVKYSPVVAEKGNLIVKFHDDTDNKDLTGVGTDTGSQDVGTNVTYNSDTDLTSLENKGYVYVSTDGKIPASIVKGTTTVTIHVKHGLQPVNPSTPGKPDQPINPNDPDPKGPKYPAGTDKASIDKTITRTIHYEGADQYTPSDVQQPVHFTASGVLDKVTGGWATPLTWSSETETFGAKSSPKIPGYHVVSVDRDANGENVAATPISHTGSDYTVTVTYAPDAQKQAENAKLHIIDINDGDKEISSFSDSGDDNTAINFAGANTTVDALLKAGYKVNSIKHTEKSGVVNDGGEGADYGTISGQWKFDDQPGFDQDFYVYLEHDITPINPENAYGRTDLTRTVTETVHYIDEATNKPVASDYTNKATFTGQGMVDKVTGKMLAIKSIENGHVTYDNDLSKEIDISAAKDSDFVWTSPATFARVGSPVISGYTVDAAKTTPSDLADGDGIKEITNVAYNHDNVEATVYYKANPVTPAVEKGSIKVTVHDVKTNQDVPGYDANSGSENVGTKFTYDTAGNIAKLKDAGYKILNPDVQIPTEISKGDQSFVIYVDHNVVPVTPENPGNGLDKDALQKSVTETVKYVVNGDQAKAPADHTATLHFDGTAYYDSVTKKWTDAGGNELADQTKNITWTANDGHQFDTVISPVVTGYHVTSVSDNYNDGNGNVKAVSGMDQNSSNFTVTVTYDKDAEPTKDQGSLTVIVHDVTDNKDLDEYGKKSGTQEVGYNFEFNKATTISELENKGYKVLNPDVTIPTQVTKGDYSYTIYVQHNIVPVTPDKPGNGLDHDQLTKTVTETVHYVVNGGTAKAPADKTASLVFNGTGYYDAVTKQWTDADGKVLADQTKNITWTAQDGNKFSVVVTPRLEGYNASVQEGYDDGNNNVKEISGINQTSNNVDVTVTYTPATPAKTQQNAQLIINDVTPGQEMQLGSYTQPGLEGDPISFGDAQQRIQDLLGKGYVWDGATYNGANLSATDYAGIAFGNYDNTDDNSGISQKWVINLVHGTTPVNPDYPDDKDGYTKDYLDRIITRDVTYVDEQGNEMKGLTPEHQEAKFTGSGYLDKVTGKWVTVENGKITGLAKGLTWTPDTDSTFDAINAKTAEGYHVISVTGNGISGFTVGQDGAVTAQTVNRDTPSSKITVVYAPDTKAPVAANGSIVYIDDTTGNTLESASFGGTVGGKINYTTADRVAYYEGKGYNVVSNNFHDGNETFKEGDNKFEVHLTHVTDTKNVTKTVTRDVTYIYEDGSQADTPVNQSVTFNGKTTTDKVTGAEKTVWDNDSQNFAATKSIDTTQYNIVKVSENNTAANVDMTNGVVAGETITPTSQNSKVVITLAKKAIPTPDQGSLTVVFHDDTEGHDIEGYGTKTGNENVGTDVTYKADTDLTNLENKGYVYVSTDGTIPGKITKGATTVTIHVKHGTRPVTPENPADPGKPVDPNKPNTATPSNPNLAKTDLEKAITRTVKYQYTDGTSAHADAVQTVNFKGQGTIDLVTGNLVNVDKDGNIVDQRGKITWDHDSQDFGNVAAINHDGYYVSSITETGTTAKIDGTAVAGETVNPNSQNSTIVITLAKNPVTPTPVQKGTVIVNYVDKTTGKTLETATSTGNEGSNVDYSTKDTITKYTNQGYKLEHDGYPTGTVTYTNGTVTYEVDLVHDTVPVNPDQPGPKTPNTPINPNDPDGPKYPDGTQPSQLTKTVTRTINYVGDGLNIPSVQKEVQFVANGVLDKVTGQWVTVDNDGKITGTANGMTWTVKGGNTDEGSFDQVAGPQTDGYYISGISSTNEAASDVDKTTGTVAGKTINHTNGNIVITINYTKNPVTPTPTPADQTVVGKQIVHYVDGDNNNAKLLDDNTNDTFVFTKSGKTGTWNTDSHKYANANAPVIDGYVAEQRTYEGQTATPGDANKEITIVYHKIGKIIPVDPTGNPIPDAPTPGYHNDPTDPTKVTPNEPTPDVPGWTTNVPNVTPDTPTGDTKVPYTKPTPTQDKGSITITVHDVTDNTDLPEYGKTSGSQNVGTSFSYDKTGTFTSLTNKGYKVVNPDVTIPTGITKGDQNIVIYVEHTTTPITPENPGKPGQPINPNDPTGPQYPNGSDQVTKNVTRTITYVDNNGNKLHDPVEQTAHFTGTGVIDNVTGKWVTPITWTGNGDLNGQNTPVIDGYHVTNVSRDGNGNNVAKVTVNHGDSDYTVVVTYTPNGKIVPVDPTGNPIPDVPTPQYPTDPSDPAKVTPNEPVPTIPGYTPEVPSVTPTNPGEDTPVVYTPITPATVQGKVTYIDDTTGKTITTDNFSGKVGDKITYTTADKISDLEGKGYELVSNNFKDGSETFTDGENSFVVHLKHAETIFTPQNPHGGDDENGKYATQKKTTFTVHYVGAGEKNPADHVETVQWHRHVSVDGVTGEVISSTPWTTDDSYSNVNTSVVDGYHADKAAANAPQADPDKDSVETVTYAPNGHIIPVDQTGTPIPGADHPVYPTDPNDPTKVTPNEPVPTVPGYTPEQETVTPVDPGTNTSVIYDRGTTLVTPEQPETPGNPGGDDNETPNKVTPNIPANPGDNGNEEGKKVTPQSPATPAENTPAASAEPQAPVAKQAAAQKPAAKSDAKTLPQTGNDENNSAAVLGLAALGLTGLVGLGKKRRKED